MNKLSKYMFGVGLGIVTLSILRWYFMWYDPSQAILGTAIGLILMGFADIYNERKYVQKRLDDNDKRMDAFSNWYAKEELK